MTEYKKFYRITALFILFSLLLYLSGLLLLSGNEIFAQNKIEIGLVVNVSTGLNIRREPVIGNNIIGSVKSGETVIISGSAKASDGSLWYKITYSGIVGYVHSDYIEIISDVADQKFEDYLSEQGFPESYKPYLRALHAQYPNWIFNAFHTDLNWNDVLKAQSIIGRNLVHISSPDSWKSFEKGAYDWINKKWYGLDGEEWVAASEEIIAYYLDPRNALTASGIFQFESLSYSPYHTLEGVKNILKNTFMSGSFTTPDTKVTYTYAETFIKAAQISGVSPYHLASRARQEQGVNGGPLSFGTVPGYEGYFNFFNVKAYATSNASALVNGAIYAATTNPTYYLPWTNQYKSILGSAVFLGSSYINKGQDTLYLQKFDVVDGGNGYFSHQYMTNVTAPTSEAASMKKAYSDEMLKSTLVFSIPVYKNMSSEAASAPAATGDNNNLLSSLSVSGFNLTPSFSKYTQDYELVVESSVQSVKVTAVSYSPSAVVNGAGTIALNYGDNKVSVEVTASSGAVRIYTINIYRKSASVSPSVNPEITSDSYTLGSVITGVSPNTSAASFLSKITVKNGSLKVLDASGKEITGSIGTGYVLAVYKSDGSLYDKYTVVVYGDVSGDGKISSIDLLIVQKHLLRINLLSGVYFTAGDNNKNGNIDSQDLLNIQKHLLNVSSIPQK